MTILNIITVIAPGQEPLRVVLDRFRKETVLMGRGEYHGDSSQPRNDIRIDDRVRVFSRAHCSFHRDARGNWTIVDDHSLNGLTYNGQKIGFRQLADGDRFTVGQTEEERVILLFSRQEPRTSEKAAEGMKRYSLREKQQIVLGRMENCDIVIRHPTVSRRHAVITQEKGRWYIEDCNSTNGVILNSTRMERKTALQQMDRISIAGTTFIFSEGYLFTQELTGGVSITAERLSKQVGGRKEKKTILDDVNLRVEPNQFVAIIGGSGAGKTTLLTCLSGMSAFSSGEVLINGEPVQTGGKSIQSLMGYVPQQDIVYDSLTLESMLRYSAKLRMPLDSSKEEIEKKIDETLQLVELSTHRGTLISRLSGGQRKRASIAVELLASPKLFFLDEPSSGLDPGTEKHLMQMLRNLSRTGKTVVMITHTVQNLDLCDQIICMGRGGRLCFSGSPDEALRFFRKQSLTDVYDILNEHSKEAADHFRSITQALQDLPVPIPEKPPKQMETMKRLWRDFRVMTLRYMEILKNSLPRLLLLLLMPIFLALLVCIAFQADGGLYAFLQRSFGFNFNRASFPFLLYGDTTKLLFSFSCAAFWTGIFNSVQEISKERTIFERERFTGVGGVPYVLSKFVPLLLLCLIQSACMVIVLQLMTNTVASVDGDLSKWTVLELSMPKNGLVLGDGLMWLELYITTLLCVLSAMCLGLVISSVASNEMALVLCPICLMPQILFSGVVGELSGFTETLSQIITCKWACLASFVSFFNCTDSNLYEKCEYSMGSYELTEGTIDAAYDAATPYLFNLNGVKSGWIALGLMCLICTVGAMLILHFRRNKAR